MSEIRCSRCGNTAAALEHPPLPGELGERVARQACAACWREWLGAQVMLINEHRLSGANPEHVDFLMGQMKVFLKLPDGGG